MTSLFTPFCSEHGGSVNFSFTPRRRSRISSFVFQGTTMQIRRFMWQSQIYICETFIPRAKLALTSLHPSNTMEWLRT